MTWPSQPCLWGLPPSSLDCVPVRVTSLFPGLRACEDYLALPWTACLWGLPPSSPDCVPVRITSLFLRLRVRVIALPSLTLPLAGRQTTPHHQRRVSAPYWQQLAVVWCPPHIRDVCAMTEVLLELGIFALFDREMWYVCTVSYYDDQSTTLLWY